jgi:hypothetical protein
VKVRVDQKYRGTDGTIYTVKEVIVPPKGTVGNKEGRFSVVVEAIDPQLGVKQQFNLDDEEFAELRPI